MPTQIGHCHQIVPIGACLYVDHRGVSEIDEKTQVAVANARLIAAAPDMAAALAACVYVLACDKSMDEAGSTKQKALQMARAVLAKARGEAATT